MTLPLPKVTVEQNMFNFGIRDGVTLFCMQLGFDDLALILKLTVEHKRSNFGISIGVMLPCVQDIS